MRACVIFNPAARGEKARRFRKALRDIQRDCELMQTSAAGDARKLAADAVASGFELVVAAGGDGTINEVLNGIGDAPGGFARACLGVLPLGTVNVFARELGIPPSLASAWTVLRHGREVRIDLPVVEYGLDGAKRRLYFAQLAGAELDARAIELVSWPLKRRMGALAYVLAGLEALRQTPSKITIACNDTTTDAELVLIGNGRLYGGRFKIFPKADLRDGLLDICLFPKAGWMTLAQCGPSLLVRGSLPASAIRVLRAPSFTLASPSTTAFEVDGELAGHLPARFSLQPLGLRVMAP